MKVLNKYLLKELTAPFFTTFFVLIFVLLSQFILKNLDRFLGKGLSFSVIIKFLFLNSAWIISLAIPMAVLVTTLITFGKLSSNNENRPLQIKSSDIEISNNEKKIKKYIPLSKRQDKPDSALWLIRQHNILKDSQIAKLVGITKNSVTSIRNKSYWNYNNLNPKDPVALNLFSQKDLVEAKEKAELEQQVNLGKLIEEADDKVADAANKLQLPAPGPATTPVTEPEPAPAPAPAPLLPPTPPPVTNKKLNNK